MGEETIEDAVEEFELIDEIELVDEINVIEEVAEAVAEFGDEELALNSDDLVEILDVIDDPVADEIVEADGALTLADVELLFEMYFEAYANSEQVTNNFFDQSVTEN